MGFPLIPSEALVVMLMITSSLSKVPQGMLISDKFLTEFVLTSLISSEILEVICGVKTQKVHHVT